MQNELRQLADMDALANSHGKQSLRLAELLTLSLPDHNVLLRLL